jgi:preprotein translocase subunit YajC
VTHFLVTLAQAAAPAAPAGGSGNPFKDLPIIPMALIFGIFYFLIIRPNSKKQKEHQQMLTELKKGDEVVTTGGIIGKISGMTDSELTLQVQEGVRIRVTRASVQGRYGAAAATKPESKAS